MADRHVTDEEIRGTGRYRPTPGIPRATCLRCRREHEAFYATQACDCRIELAERRTYAEWLDLFRVLGLGVLKSEADAKFPFERDVTGRTALTMHLQSNLNTNFPEQVFDDSYYDGFDGWP